MIASVVSGTQTTVISTEHTLSERLSPGVYQIKLGTENMASGDTVVLKIYRKVLSGSSYGVQYSLSYTNAQTEPVKESVPISEDIAVNLLHNML